MSHHYKNIYEDHILKHSHRTRHRGKKFRGEYIPVPSTYYDLPIRAKRYKKESSVFYPLPPYSKFAGYDVESHMPHLPYSSKSHFVGDVGKCDTNWCSIGYVSGTVESKEPNGTKPKVFQLYAQKNYINGYLDKYHNYFNYKIIDNHNVDILLNLPADKILRSGDTVSVGGYSASGGPPQQSMGYSGQFKVTINDTGAGFVYIPV